MSTGPYRVHPFAEVFPLMSGPEFAELVADIKANGLREPIVLSANRRTLIDGRNRYRACVEATVDPVFDALPDFYTDLQILDLIVSSNVARRHLNQGQLAAIAVEYEVFYAQLIKEREAQRKSRTGGPAAALSRDDTNRTVTLADPPESHQAVSSEADTSCHCGNDAVGHIHPRPVMQPRPTGWSRDRAAKVTGATGRRVGQAKAVKRDAPDRLHYHGRRAGNFRGAVVPVRW